eukprot:3298820-Amphidinium_carterae.2
MSRDLLGVLSREVRLFVTDCINNHMVWGASLSGPGVGGVGEGGASKILCRTAEHTLSSPFQTPHRVTSHKRGSELANQTRGKTSSLPNGVSLLAPIRI